MFEIFPSFIPHMYQVLEFQGKHFNYFNRVSVSCIIYVMNGMWHIGKRALHNNSVLTSADFHLQEVHVYNMDCVYVDSLYASVE